MKPSSRWTRGLNRISNKRKRRRCPIRLFATTIRTLYAITAITAVFIAASPVAAPGLPVMIDVQRLLAEKPKATVKAASEPETYVVTAYTAEPESTGKSRDHPAYGITASGERVREGRTAACPPELPFGTRVHIEGVGERACVDRGGAIEGNRLDIFISDYDRAVQFGRQELDVRIIPNEKGTIE